MIPGYPWHPWEQFSSGDIDLEHFFSKAKQCVYIEFHTAFDNILIESLTMPKISKCLCFCLPRNLTCFESKHRILKHTTTEELQP